MLRSIKTITIFLIVGLAGFSVAQADHYSDNGKGAVTYSYTSNAYVKANTGDYYVYGYFQTRNSHNPDIVWNYSGKGDSRKQIAGTKHSFH